MSSEREALRILPEEMWNHIFSTFISSDGVHREGVDNDKPVDEIVSSDLLSSSRVCKTFARILQTNETTWLFKEVRFVVVILI